MVVGPVACQHQQEDASRYQSYCEGTSILRMPQAINDHGCSMSNRCTFCGDKGEMPSIVDEGPCHLGYLVSLETG